MAERGRSFIRMALVAIACALALAGCGTDLGECDMSALGGSTVPLQLAPHTGQVLVNNTCAGGTCHSSLAKGELRNGAPADLDFDVVPTDNSPAELARALSGGSNVHDEAEEMWELIDSGEMPPEGKRGALASTDKEAIRNWLACGAQVVAAPAPTQPVTADLTSIHAALAGLTCKGCHTTGSIDNAFLSGDACVMYNALVGKTSVSSGACGTAKLPLVTAGKPDESLFLQKLNASPAPPCGASMPFGNPSALGASDPALVASIRTWIMSGAPKPAGCP